MSSILCLATTTSACLRDFSSLAYLIALSSSLNFSGLKPTSSIWVYFCIFWCDSSILSNGGGGGGGNTFVNTVTNFLTLSIEFALASLFSSL